VMTIHSPRDAGAGGRVSLMGYLRGGPATE
jgi:hypothetical protein